MRCLWPKLGVFAKPSLALLGFCVMAAGAFRLPTSPDPRSALQAREQGLRRVPAHMSEFAPVLASSAVPSCAHTRPPEALLTPDPVMQDLSDDLRVRVSFVIGADGHVHSAFILNSGGRSQDEVIMQAVRRWRGAPFGAETYAPPG